ncbi:DUF3465 domain-containing protein [Neisseria zoodegmatis]|uniref:Protein of uncharacterized function (DUF3465) n=1 Tax=Neisseria zoodegmatis TaxID=326523 RepID=A0AB38DQV6_9NEIS|nr:DUF3465 domain-containing protein [Neisseria zoodegmatis]OSI09873.1 hypothetical protein BWD10_07795 [Neisseria zoodegmatis]SNU79727.1 Protein of uncharacterised function (DUF3465) [Neisseria zoodegmatis]
MNKNWILPAIVAVALFGYQYVYKQTQPSLPHAETSSPASPSINQQSADDILQTAFERRQSNIQIAGSGTVSKTLPDDNKGSRHQRFILKLNSGQSLLVAHNIDLAPKIKGLKKGDTVAFYGEYEWSEKGGVIHWTHHDPQGKHPDGWLKHNGVIYQ